MSPRTSRMLQAGALVALNVASDLTLAMSAPWILGTSAGHLVIPSVAVLAVSSALFWLSRALAWTVAALYAALAAYVGMLFVLFALPCITRGACL